MIRTKEDYNHYIKADSLASNRPRGGIISRLIYSETYFIQTYLLLLRKLEYLTNRKKNLPEKIYYYYILWRYKRLSFKLQISIPPNVAGPGLAVFHLGNIILNPFARLGKGCSLQPGVMIGQKDTAYNVPTVGDNVYFGPGSKAMGKLTIGNNVIVAPNSVVIKDVPDNCVVSGVPAVIIKRDGIKVSAITNLSVV